MDIITNFIAVLNRSAVQKQISTLSLYNKVVIKILKLLYDAGFIRGFSVISKKHLRIYLKFDKMGNSTIRNISAVSKPGKRIYVTAKELRSRNSSINLISPLGHVLLSTSKGLKFDNVASLENLGGEAILNIK